MIVRLFDKVHMNTQEYKINNIRINLLGVDQKTSGVSNASLNIAQIIHGLKDKTVLDIGCGSGFLTILAIKMGAAHVVCSDVDNIEEIIKANLKLNNILPDKITFKQSNLFEKFNEKDQFDVIIANLPQHALPANDKSKKLLGKYGGFDGTDIVCRSLSESFFHLNQNGRYFGSISYLTNYKRTKLIASSLYKIISSKEVIKQINLNEMMPYLSSEEFLEHLLRLKENNIISFSAEGKMTPLEYLVQYSEFKKT